MEDEFDVQTYINQEAKLSSLPSLVQQVEDAEQFLNELNDITYDVSKTLHGWVGKKVSRRLKLTNRGIANLRSSGETSSLYEYERIIKVTMSNINTFVIEYKGAKHPYTYASPNAVEIVHEIQTRIKLFNATRKKRLTIRLASPYLDTLIQLRNDASNDSKRHSLFLTPSESDALRNSILNRRTSRNTIQQSRSSKLTVTDNLKLTSLINSILMEKGYEEAKAVKNFYETFDSIEKHSKNTLETTRNFLNSLKDRIMSARYDALVSVAPKHDSVHESQSDYISREVETCIEKVILLKLYDRIMEILAKTNKKIDQKIETQVDLLSKLPQSYFGIPAGLEASSKWQLAVIEINEINSQYLPQDKLRSILNCIAAIVDTAQFESDRRLKKIASGGNSLSSSASPQSTSPSPSHSNLRADASGTINSTISELNATSIEPSSNSPNTSSQSNSQSNPQSKPVDLSADDLLPILIYVLVNSKLSQMETQCQYMWQMSDPADLVGEAGYYLTMFSSAVEYLKQHEEDQILQSSEPLDIGTSATGYPHPSLIDSDDEASPTTTTWNDPRSTASSPGNIPFTPGSVTTAPRSLPARMSRGREITIGSRAQREVGLSDYMSSPSNLSRSTSTQPSIVHSGGSSPIISPNSETSFSSLCLDGDLVPRPASPI